MPEYFIKKDFNSEAEGPVTLDQLKAMVPTGKITPQTLHFYDDVIGWQPIQMNFALTQALFPNKPKLSLKKAPSPQAAASHKKTQPGLTVEDMLETAQGHTDARRAQTQEKQWQERVGALSLPVLTLLTLFMGGLLIFANWAAGQALVKGDWTQLLSSPGLPLGVVVLVLAGLLLLTVVAVYPGVRYVGLILMGYFGIHAWSYLAQGLPQGWWLLWAGLAYGLGVLLVTLTLNFFIFFLATLLSFAGIGAYAYFLFLRL